MTNASQGSSPAEKKNQEKQKRFYEKLAIHTMPKRFLSLPSENTKQTSKSTGILILVGGGIVLVGLLVFLYFFLVSPPESWPWETAGQSSQPVAQDAQEQQQEQEQEPERTEEGENRQEDTDQDMPGQAEDELSDTSPDPKDQEQSGERTDKETDQDQTGSTEATESVGTATTSLETDQQTGGDRATSTQSEQATTSPADNSESVPEQDKMPTIQVKDGDGDGLHDAEESVLGCDPGMADSDQDGYSDREELRNLYNPAGSGQIIVNSAIAKYSNSANNYSLYYPKTWQAKTVGGEDSVLFEIGNEQFVQIISEPKQDQDLEAWYKEKFDVTSVKSGQRVYKKGWSGIKSEDGRIYYLTHPQSGHILTVTYNLGMKETAVYQNIFEMMVRSLAMTG